MLSHFVLLLAATAASPDPPLEYTLRFDPADTSGIAVELRVKDAPASIQLAAHAHPEYDDKFWRYVADIRVTGGEATPIDSVRWQLNNRAGDLVIRYRVNFPREAPPRAAWRPYLTATGGLVGGPHSFLYVIGLEMRPAKVTLVIPDGWLVATGLEGKTTARTFTAPDIHTLMESPMLVGKLSDWTFTANNIPHRIFYWRLPNSIAFDSTAFTSSIEKLVRQTIDLFGTTPYREYSFLFQDGAWRGGLEHPNSVTIGAQSEELAKNPHLILPEVAHEFVHTWNLMAIKPAAYREVDYKVQPPVPELWFSEGLTIFYADLLLRRSGLPAGDSSRIGHLERLIARYLAQPGHARFSAEEISRVEYNASPAALGDYLASSHLQGEIIGTLLDLRIRDATNGARSMDHVMRLLYERTRQKRFVSMDVQKAVEDVCTCSAADIFDRYVFSGNPVDFDTHLRPLGIKAEVRWAPSMNDDGTPAKDLRASAWLPEGEKNLRLRVTNPNSIWGRADLHSNDVIVAINGNPVATWPEFRAFLSQFAIGDTATFTVRRGDSTLTRRVVMAGFDRPVVRLLPMEAPTKRQLDFRSAWSRGLPGVSAPAPSQQGARQ